REHGAATEARRRDQRRPACCCCAAAACAAAAAIAAPPDAVPAPAAVVASARPCAGSQTHPELFMMITSALILRPRLPHSSSHSVTRALGVAKTVAFVVAHAPNRVGIPRTIA